MLSTRTSGRVLPFFTRPSTGKPGDVSELPQFTIPLSMNFRLTAGRHILRRGLPVASFPFAQSRHTNNVADQSQIAPNYNLIPHNNLHFL